VTGPPYLLPAVALLLVVEDYRDEQATTGLHDLPLRTEPRARREPFDFTRFCVTIVGAVLVVIAIAALFRMVAG
jgi:hypothetical protein